MPGPSFVRSKPEEVLVSLITPLTVSWKPALATPIVVLPSIWIEPARIADPTSPADVAIAPDVPLGPAPKTTNGFNTGVALVKPICSCVFCVTVVVFAAPPALTVLTATVPGAVVMLA